MSKSRARQQNSVRIIAGRWRGRRLAIPRGARVRPTPDRVRETLFNWLAPSLAGLSCLDLYAGTGALGIEAASRGARGVWLVERDATLANHLRTQIETLGVEGAHVVKTDADAFLAKSPAQRFDVAFLDPPYELPLEPVLARLRPVLADRARIYVERPQARGTPDPLETLVATLPGFTLIRRSRAASVAFGLLELEHP